MSTELNQPYILDGSTVQVAAKVAARMLIDNHLINKSSREQQQWQFEQLSSVEEIRRYLHDIFTGVKNVDTWFDDRAKRLAYEAERDALIARVDAQHAAKMAARAREWEKHPRTTLTVVLKK